MIIKRIMLLVVSIFFLVGVAGCSDSSTQMQKPSTLETKSIELTVSAAASLKNAMEEIKTAYGKEKLNITITYNFGASGSLQQQIEQGAAADIFISAAAKQMDALEDKNFILDDTRKNLLGNKLVLVIPEGSSTITDFKDLESEKINHIAIGDSKSVPAGQYAEEVLKNLKLLDKLKSKAVYGKDVSEVLSWVATGNADAGIVYETDAKASDKVKIVAIASENLHKPIVYPAAVLKESKNVDAARDFISYLYSDKAKPVFEKYGFSFIAK